MEAVIFHLFGNKTRNWEISCFVRNWECFLAFGLMIESFTVICCFPNDGKQYPG
jgi:hypothetical protein